MSERFERLVDHGHPEEVKREYRVLFIAGMALSQEVTNLKLSIEKLTAFVKGVAEGPHEGQGFCYNPYGFRECRCQKYFAGLLIKEGDL